MILHTAWLKLHVLLKYFELCSSSAADEMNKNDIPGYILDFGK